MRYIFILFISHLFFSHVNANETENYLTGLQAAKTRNYTQALTLWLDSADKGHSDSQYRLGVMYRLGLGTKQDFRKSFQWFRLAADQNHPQAQYN